ncbi:MAG TPA: hypothetical protein VGX28_06925 [Frankiaceae bacterium]|jgi:hypothetical protein|nr:hypothetical protein [Frankiaceae bacterium]
MTLDERAFSQALHDAVRDPLVPPAMAARVVAGHRRRRRMLAGATVGATAAAAFAAVLAVPALRAGDDPTPPAAAVSGTYWANGVVIAKPGMPVLFCRPGYRVVPADPPPPACDFSVTATGVDLDRLASRDVEPDGTVWGYAWLAGRLDGDAFEVLRQDAPRREGSLFGDAYSAPCAAPPGGWPVHVKEEGPTQLIDHAKAWAAAHPGEVVQLAYRDARGERQVIVAVTAVHPQVVEDALRPVYGEALCVVPSRYSVAELDAARADLRAYLATHEGTFEEPKLTSDAQPVFELHVKVRVPELHELVTRHDPRLIDADAWLEPISL